MVASSQPLASLAGMKVLLDGGNAIDAAVATAGVGRLKTMRSVSAAMRSLCVFRRGKNRSRHSTRAGDRPGRGFRVLPQEPIRGDAAARDSRRDRPGAMHRWTTLFNSYGTKSLRDVLRSAIRHAEEGFPVAELTAQSWHESESSLKADEGARANYLINGRTPKAGEIFTNPRMAKTLRRIADEGTDYFYRGEVAEKIVRLFGKIRGCLLGKTLPIIDRIGSPITADYRGYDIRGMPPATQGFVALEMLKILEGFELKALGPGSAAALT